MLHAELVALQACGAREVLFFKEVHGHIQVVDVVVQFRRHHLFAAVRKFIHEQECHVAHGLFCIPTRVATREDCPQHKDDNDDGRHNGGDTYNPDSLFRFHNIVLLKLYRTH